MKIISEATETIAEIGLKEINRLKIALAEKDEKIKRQALSSKRENDEWAKDVLRLTETIKYLCGIAVKGEKREINEDETVEQFVLGYVKKCEQHLATLTTERDRQNDFIDKVEIAYPEFYEHHIEALRGGEEKGNE